jgi:hypothetical protein
MTTLEPLRAGFLQRRCACGGTPGLDGECEACRQKRLGLQRASFLSKNKKRIGQGNALAHPPQSNKAGNIPPLVYDTLNSPGQPLDPATRTFFEPRFGHDFSRVRVHTDGQATESARAVNALAYTVGQDVVFGAGQYAPQTEAGRKLLAHELTHTIQQERTPSAQPLMIAPAESLSERAATTAEARPGSAVSSLNHRELQRQPLPASPSAPTLSYTPETPVQGQCGDFSWKITWRLNGATAATNGFIVQKVKFVTLTQTCGDANDDTFDIWWEAWQVKDGKIRRGISDEEHAGDEFRTSNTNGSKGSVYMTGAAKFMEGYTEPFNWGRLKQAGRLAATDKQPAGWSEPGSKYRFIGVSDFFCCEGQHRSSKLNIEELDV